MFVPPDAATTQMEDNNECDHFVNSKVSNKCAIIVKCVFRILCAILKINAYKIKLKGKLLITNGRVMFFKNLTNLTHRKEIRYMLI